MRGTEWNKRDATGKIIAVVKPGDKERIDSVTGEKIPEYPYGIGIVINTDAGKAEGRFGIDIHTTRAGVARPTHGCMSGSDELLLMLEKVLPIGYAQGSVVKQAPVYPSVRPAARAARARTSGYNNTQLMVFTVVVSIALSYLAAKIVAGAIVLSTPVIIGLGAGLLAIAWMIIKAKRSQDAEFTEPSRAPPVDWAKIRKAISFSALAFAHIFPVTYSALFLACRAKLLTGFGLLSDLNFESMMAQTVVTVLFWGSVALAGIYWGVRLSKALARGLVVIVRGVVKWIKSNPVVAEENNDFNNEIYELERSVVKMGEDIRKKEEGLRDYSTEEKYREAREKEATKIAALKNKLAEAEDQLAALRARSEEQARDYFEATPGRNISEEVSANLMDWKESHPQASQDEISRQAFAILTQEIKGIFGARLVDLVIERLGEGKDTIAMRRIISAILLGIGGMNDFVASSIMAIVDESGEQITRKDIEDAKGIIKDVLENKDGLLDLFAGLGLESSSVAAMTGIADEPKAEEFLRNTQKLFLAQVQLAIKSALLKADDEINPLMQDEVDAKQALKPFEPAHPAFDKKKFIVRSAVVLCMAAAITGGLVTAGYTMDAEHMFDDIDLEGAQLTGTNSYANAVTQSAVIAPAAQANKYLETEVGGFSPITDMLDVTAQRALDAVHLLGLENNPLIKKYSPVSGGPLEIGYAHAQRLAGNYAAVYDIDSAKALFTELMKADAAAIEGKLRKGYGRQVNLTYEQLLMLTAPGPYSLAGKERALSVAILANSGASIDNYNRHYTLAPVGEYNVRIVGRKDLRIKDAGELTLADALSKALGVEKEKLPASVEVAELGSEDPEYTEVKLYNNLSRGWDYLCEGSDLTTLLGRPEVRKAIEDKG
jgi:uncharacterized membrane protein